MAREFSGVMMNPALEVEKTPRWKQILEKCCWVLGILLIAWLFIPTKTSPGPPASAFDESNVKQLLIACRVHATEHEGEYPSKLHDLYPDYVDSETLFRANARSDNPPRSYFYRAGLTEQKNFGEPMILSPIISQNGINVGFVGGEIKQFEENDEELVKIREKFATD